MEHVDPPRSTRRRLRLLHQPLVAHSRGSRASLHLLAGGGTMLTLRSGASRRSRRRTWPLPSAGLVAAVLLATSCVLSGCESVYAVLLCAEGTSCPWDSRQQTRGERNFVQISAGAEHSCGIDDAGEVVCWGDDSHGSSTGSPLPIPNTLKELGIDRSFVHVSADFAHSCVLDDQGRAHCWGYGFYGFDQPPSTQFRTIDSTAEVGCGVRETGSLECWGLPENGLSQPPNATFEDIEIGGDHACGLTDEAELVCWGEVRGGTALPSGDGPFRAVAVGFAATCAIEEEGSLRCWLPSGDWGSSELGDVPSGDFADVSIGWDQACALAEDGALACWGADYNSIVEPPPETFQSVSVGFEHACGITSDGRTLCWGDTDDGQELVP